MVTELLYQTDSYLRAFEATVVGVSEAGDGGGPAVALDRTAFYPGGGGQPADQGWLRWHGGEARVMGVRREGLLHALAAPSSEFLVSGSESRVTSGSGAGTGSAERRVGAWVPAVETRVQGEVDWERRYQLMRTHTALHVLCGVIWRDYGAQVTGGQMEPGTARMDFELERMSADFASEIERRVNEEVAAARPVRVRLLPREEAFRIPDLIRTKINLLPPQIQQVRVVEIDGLDTQADGGTHVANTREVGRVRVVGHESKGRINKRLRIAVEP